MEKVTFLGPIGSTFSHDAYVHLSRIHNTPQVNDLNYIEAKSNSEILDLIRLNGGYGITAMETLAEGRVLEPVESFINLINLYSSTEQCPFTIIGSIKMKVKFCLIVNKGVSKKSIQGVVAHPKSLGACKLNLNRLFVPLMPVSSNGEGARLISEDLNYKNFAAVGPKSAAEKYGLEIIEENFEDQEAYTTFYLIGPASERFSYPGMKNRALIVFKLAHKPNALVKSLSHFGNRYLNIIHIHSTYSGNGFYNFAIEVDVSGSEHSKFSNAMDKFKNNVDSFLCFGPFEVLSV